MMTIIDWTLRQREHRNATEWGSGAVNLQYMKTNTH